MDNNNESNQDLDKKDQEYSPSNSSGPKPPNFKNYDFNIAELFKRAYQLSGENNWILAQGLAIIVILSIVVLGIFVSAYDGGEALMALSNQSAQENQPAIMSPSYQVTFELLMTVILAPLWTGVSMSAISSARKQTTRLPYILSFYRYLPILAITSAIVSLMISFGFMLFFIPGLYLFVATTFALPLVFDKELRPIKAITSSIAMVNKFLAKMLLLYLIFLALFMIVILSFGFAYLWIGPLYFNVKAILYQDLFCYQPMSKHDIIDSNNEGVFDA